MGEVLYLMSEVCSSMSEVPCLMRLREKSAGFRVQVSGLRVEG
jgi:hypothetical protein